MALESMTIPNHAAFWTRLPNRCVRVYLAPLDAAPAYNEVFARGLDWPSLASAVTALEVNSWCEVVQPKVG